MWVDPCRRATDESDDSLQAGMLPLEVEGVDDIASLPGEALKVTSPARPTREHQNRRRLIHVQSTRLLQKGPNGAADANLLITDTVVAFCRPCVPRWG